MGYKKVKSRDVKFLIQDLSAGDIFKKIKGDDCGEIFKIKDIHWNGEVIFLTNIKTNENVMFSFDAFHERFNFMAWHTKPQLKDGQKKEQGLE